MKPTSCLFIFSVLVLAGHLIGQEFAADLASDDLLGHQLAGLLGWSIPAAGFLGLIFYHALRWRQRATEPVVADES